MKVLALDFDGVISDSAAESFVVALRTYAQIRPQSRVRPPGGDLTRLGRAGVEAHELYAAFVDLMALGNRAEDYAVALWLLENEIAISDQAEYDEQRRAQDQGLLADFHRLFYRERRALSESDRAAWLALLRPYPEFIEVLQRRFEDVTLALATAKDRRSVKILLRAYGIAHLFPDERILDKETGVSKRAHLVALKRRLGGRYSEITFVDDKVSHLEAVAELGARCALAAWGYNGAREQEIARDRGFLVCRLEDVEPLLFEEN